MKKNIISIIIPTYNSETFILETLESIVLQNMKVEVIIVDNYSNDQTLNIALKFKQLHDADLTIYYNEDRNVSKSRNIGKNYANGEFLMFLDSDDLLEPSALKLLYSKIKDFDIVFGGWENFGEGIIRRNFGFYDKQLDPLTTYLTHKPTISTALIRRSALQNWDEERNIWEVTLYFLNIILSGAKSIFINNIVTKIRQHSSENRVSLKEDHFHPVKTLIFLLLCKDLLILRNKLSAQNEVVIDKDIIAYSYQGLKLGYDRINIYAIVNRINLKLLPMYNDYRIFNIYYFIDKFKGIRGLLLFFYLNKVIGRT